MSENRAQEVLMPIFIVVMQGSEIEFGACPSLGLDHHVATANVPIVHVLHHISVYSANGHVHALAACASVTSHLNLIARVHTKEDG